MKRLAIVVLLAACRSKAEPEKTPAEVASGLVAPKDDDVSPLDTASALPAGRQDPFREAFCVAAPEPEAKASFSELAASGVCVFQHRGAASCRAHGDDFYAILQRPLADGNKLEIYLNVEAYTGPGTYEKKVEVLALLRRGLSLYRWSSRDASATLGFGEGGMSPATRSAEQANAGTPTRVQLERTELAAEPGTSTTGTIALGGTIGCVLTKPPWKK